MRASPTTASPRIARKCAITRELAFPGVEVVAIDADQPLEQVMLEAQSRRLAPPAAASPAGCQCSAVIRSSNSSACRVPASGPSRAPFRLSPAHLAQHRSGGPGAAAPPAALCRCLALHAVAPPACGRRLHRLRSSPPSALLRAPRQRGPAGHRPGDDPELWSILPTAAATVPQRWSASSRRWRRLHPIIVWLGTPRLAADASHPRRRQQPPKKLPEAEIIAGRPRDR